MAAVSQGNDIMADTNGTYIPFMRKHYYEKVVPAMQEKFQYKNRMQMPTIDKVVLNMGVGQSIEDAKSAMMSLSLS